MSNKWPRKALCEVLEVSRTGLRNWYCEGAPLDEDLSGDPVLVIQWYMRRPIFSFQWSAMWRLDNYPAIARRIRRERRKAAAGAEPKVNSATEKASQSEAGGPAGSVSAEDPAE
jgi:hypothetical protein